MLNSIWWQFPLFEFGKISRHSSVNLLLLLLSFQSAIALHESNGIDIVIALVLNDINPLGKQRMDLVLELKVRKAVISLRMFSSSSCNKI